MFPDTFTPINTPIPGELLCQMAGVTTSPGLGSDDSMPTHILILDRRVNRMVIALLSEGMEFLTAQHPPAPELTPEQAEDLRQEVLKFLESEATHFEQMTAQEMNFLGMFKMFTQPHPQLVEQRKEMEQFLSEHLDPKIKSLLVRFSN